MMTLKTRWLAGLLLGGLAALSTTAGVVVEKEQRDPGAQTTIARLVFQLDAGRLRIDSETAEGDQLTVIFRGDKPVVWTIDRGEGTYYELTPEKVAALRKQIEEAQAQMQEALQQLPPEQRKAAEEMMAQAGQAVGPPPPATVRVTGQNQPVGSFTCTRYDVQQGTARREIWAAPIDQLQLQAEEFKTLKDLADLLAPLGTLGPQALSALVAGEKGPRGIEGFPIRVLTYSEGRVVSEEVVTGHERKALAPDSFELPAGLRKTELGEEGLP